MQTGNFHVCIKVITFQSILLFKGLYILLLTFPAPAKMKIKEGRRGSIKFDFNAKI
jgi:hypothetical protein